MTADIQTIWEIYSKAWGDISPEERIRLLEASVVHDVTFTAPDAGDHGVTKLIATQEAFQRDFPGASFRTISLIAHNDQSLAAWSMLDRSGTQILTGNSYARYDEARRIVHLAGFWRN